MDVTDLHASRLKTVDFMISKRNQIDQKNKYSQRRGNKKARELAKEAARMAGKPENSSIPESLPLSEGALNAMRLLKGGIPDSNPEDIQLENTAPQLSDFPQDAQPLFQDKSPVPEKIPEDHVPFEESNDDPLLTGTNTHYCMQESDIPEDTNKTYWVNTFATSRGGFGATSGGLRIPNLQSLHNNSSTFRLGKKLNRQTYQNYSTTRKGKSPQRYDPREYSNQQTVRSMTLKLGSNCGGRSFKTLKKPSFQGSKINDHNFDNINAVFNIENWIENKKISRFGFTEDNKMKIDDVLLLAKRNKKDDENNPEDRIFIPKMNVKMIDSIMRHDNKPRKFLFDL